MSVAPDGTLMPTLLIGKIMLSGNHLSIVGVTTKNTTVIKVVVWKQYKVTQHVFVAKYFRMGIMFSFPEGCRFVACIFMSCINCEGWK